MATPEQLEVAVIEMPEQSKVKRCGLVDWENPEARELHRKPRLEFEEEVLFDHKCNDSDRGWVSFRGNVLRLDHRLEEDPGALGQRNEVRSVVEVLDTDDYGYTLCKTHNLINHWDGNTYLEVHESIEGPDGVVLEPEVGSAEVLEGDHTDVVLHYQIAYEAETWSTPSPLSQAA